MKQIYSIIFATLMALFLLPACSEDIYNEYNYDPSLEEGLSFSFTPGDMTFYAGGGEIKAKIETKRHWVIILRDDWLTVSQTTGDGNQELTFTAAPLPEGTGDRYCEIKIFISDGKTQRTYTYQVTQYSYVMNAELEEDFQSGIPDTWSVYNYPHSTRSTTLYSTWEADEILGRSAARAYNNTSYTILTNDCESWLVTPGIYNMTGELTLSFDSFAIMKGSDPESAEFEVYVMNGAEPATSEKIRLTPNLADPAVIEWTPSDDLKLDCMTGIIYIGFKYSPKAPNSTEWYITNVKIRNPGAKEDIEKIWLIGGCNGWNIYNPYPEFVLTKEPDAAGPEIFSGTFPISSEDAAAGFRFFINLGDWDTSKQIGSAEENYVEEHVSLNEYGAYSGPCVWGRGNWVLDNHPGGDLKITLDLSTMRVSFESVNRR